jgi:putative ABC transport system permease protein
VGEERGGEEVMEGFFQDFRIALRGLMRRPGFTLIVVLTLAFGIGVNSSIFSLVYGVLLRPFPFQQVDQLVRVWRRLPQRGIERAPVSPPAFLEWRDQNGSFTEMAAFVQAFATLTGGREPQEVQAVKVSANLFRLLGVKAARGRALLPGEDQPSAAPVVVLSDRFWRQSFGGRPGVVGSSITLDGKSYQVVGVMPADFQFEEGELWMPLVFAPAELVSRGRSYLDVIARLKDGVSLRQARANLATISQGNAQDLPASSRRIEVTMVPLYEQVVGDIRPTLLVLMGAVGFVLLIACANVANLLLARTTDRQGEIAVRVALGASRGRLFRQTLTESLLLALLGGLCGLLIANWLTAWLIHLKPPQIPRLDEVRMDLPVLVFTLGVALLAGLLFGWGPALRGSRSQVHQLLKQGGGTAGASRSKLRSHNPLAVIEVALALVLLIGAGLLIRSFQQLQAVAPGFDPRHVLTASFSLPPAEYQNERPVAFANQLLERLRGLPEVEAAAVTTSLPLGRVDSRRTYYVEGQATTPESTPVAVVDAVSPGFFRAMGIPLLQGRGIEETDRPQGPRVAVVDETLAKRWFPAGDAVGKRMVVPGVAMDYRTIVGVAHAVRRYGLDADPTPQIYVPLHEAPSPMLSVVVRYGSSPARLGSALRASVWSLDPNLPVEVDTLAGMLAESLSQPRFNTRLIGVLGALAMMLAVVGIYAVMAYSVSRRRHEMGIRMALGGERRTILRLVLKEALRLTVTGLVLGVIAAFAVTRLMSSLLFGIRPTDPTTFAVLSVLLGAVSLAASYLPARRATRVDPMIALRSE